MNVIRTVLVDPVQTAFNAMSQQLGTFLPSLLGALVILLVGLFIAKGLESLAVRLLRTVRLDTAADKLKISDVLMRGGITLTSSELIGAFVYWFVMFLVLIAALNALNLTVAAQLFERVVSYLPNVVSAIFLLGVAIFFASFLGTTVRAAASNAGLAQANFLGQLVQAAMLVFASIVVLEQLRVDVSLLHHTLVVLIACVGLGVAIAIGLGTKDLAGRMVGDFIERMRSSGRRR